MPRAGEKSNQKAVNKYNKAHYETVHFRMFTGEREEIKQHAEMRGESLNAFLRRAVYEQIKRDKTDSQIE